MYTAPSCSYWHVIISVPGHFPAIHKVLLRTGTVPTLLPWATSGEWSLYCLPCGMSTRSFKTVVLQMCSFKFCLLSLSVLKLCWYHILLQSYTQISHHYVHYSSVMFLLVLSGWYHDNIFTTCPDLLLPNPQSLFITVFQSCPLQCEI